MCGTPLAKTIHMLGVTNKLFYTGSVNGPPRGDASSIGGGFRAPTLYTEMTPGVTQANGAWQAVRPTLTPAAAAGAAAAAGTPASATDVALALGVLGAAQPPPVLP
jgi:hypothetical protein